jgi:hypothetical protein
MDPTICKKQPMDGQQPVTCARRQVLEGHAVVGHVTRFPRG